MSRRGEVWNNFDKKDSLYAICKLCKKTLSYKSSTGNLTSHIKSNHGTVYLAQAQSATTTTSAETVSHTPQQQVPPQILCLPQEQQTNDVVIAIPSTSSALPLQPSVEPPSKRQRLHLQTMQKFVSKRMTPEEKRRVDRDLLELFINDYQPFSIVEDKGFKNFAKHIPGYSLPNRKTISSAMIPALYEKTLGEVREVVARDVQSVCLTTDCWTSSQTESYVAVTAHYTDDHFEHQQVLLECRGMKERHTSANLSAELKRVTEEWKLTNKIIFAVSDNAKNIENAIKNLGWKWFGCYAHSLNLIITDALKPLDTCIEDVKKIVSHFKRSTSALDMLLNYQMRNMTNNGDPKRLIQQVPTRWNSTYYMIKRFVMLEEAIKHCMALIDKDWPYISITEWDMMRQLVQVLGPFEEFTSSISGDQYMTGSLVIVVTNCLQSLCDDFLANDEFSHFTEAVKDVVKKMKEGLQERFPRIEYSKTYALCTLLDPRFKCYGFQNDNAYTDIKRHVHNLIIDIINKNNPTEEREPPEGPSNDHSAWAKFDELLRKKKPQGSATARAIRELQMYVDDEMLPRKNSEGTWNNPAHWWREHRAIYPHLSQIYRTKCNVVATSVPCERLFSKTGLIVSDRRCNLKTQKVEQLAFLNMNLNPKRFK